MILIVSLSFLVIPYNVNCQTTRIFTSCGACITVECWDHGGAEGLARSISLTNSVYGDGNAGRISSGWTGLLNNDWNTGGNWYSGSVPAATDDVTIDVVGTGNYPVISNANAVANSVTIVAGALLTMQNGYNLTISSGGSFINSGSFNAAASTGAVEFAGTGTTTFTNITSNGVLALTKPPVINGTFTINAGTVSGNAPTYNSSSTLVYNTGSAYTTATEWNAGSASTAGPGVGIPQNIIIQSGSVSIAASGGTADRALAGNIFINTGATFTLSSTLNHNLYIQGNWTNSGTFSHNSRTVSFTGSSNQTITGNTTFYDLTQTQGAGAKLMYAAAKTIINRNLTVNSGTMSPNANTLIEFTGTGNLAGANNKVFYDLQIDNTSTMTITNAGVDIAHDFVNNGIYTYTSGPGRLTTFKGSGVTQSLSGSPTATTNFNNLTIGSNLLGASATTLNASIDFSVNGGSMSFLKGSFYNGNNNTTTFSTAAATVSGPGTANFYNATTNVALNLGSGISTINNNLQLNPGGSVITNPPFYNTAATLTYNTTTPMLNTSIEWTNNTGLTGTGAPFNVTVQNTNNVVIAGDRSVPGTLSIATVANALNINNYTLTVNSGVTGAGSLTGSQTSGLILGGTTTALRFTAGGFNNYLKTFTLNTGGSAVLGNALNITASNGVTPQTYGSTHGTITVNGLSFSSGGFLTLKSDINGDAVVGISSGQIAGNVTVERFIPGRRAWRFLSVPFASSSQTIRGAWQEGATPYPDYNVPDYSGDVVYNPNPGYGTAITYAHGTTAFGYDENTTANPSIKIWNAAISSPDWATLPQSVAATDGTNTQIINYPAYCLFVRGSRAVDLSQAASATADNTTLRIIGTLNTGTISKSYPTTAGNWVLIGNPYASPINILSVLTANGSSKFTQNKFWVWDPRYAGTYGVGGYITYNGSLMVPAGSSYSGGTNAQSGQAFMLEATTGPATSVTFTESCKITSQAANVFGIKAATLQKHPAIFTNLVLPTGELLDGVGIGFGKQYAAKVDKDDATKLWNIDENIALVRDEATLAIEARPVPSNADTLFFRLYLRQQPYALKLFSQDLPENLPGKAWLVDKYLNTQTEVNLYDTTVYNFTPNTDTNSYRNRFMLVFSHARPGCPPVIDTLISKIKARIYPNPVSGKTFRLILGNATGGNYTLAIYNTAGRLIATRNINYTYGQNTYSVTVPPGITSGTYIVQVMNDNGIVIGLIPLVISR